jgi:nickel transport protein
MKFFALWIVGAALLLNPAPVSAHGTDYRILSDAPAVSAEFFYADGEPMRYAEILIFAPENDTVEYQNGRTDQNGRFAFVPNAPGSWKIRVNDGMGHAVNTSVAFKGPEPQAAPDAAAAAEIADHGHHAHDMPLWSRAGFGLSVLINIFLGLYLWKGRRS